MITTLVTEVIQITTGEGEEEEGGTWDTIGPLPQGEGTIKPLDQDTWPHLLLSISKFVFRNIK